jgi:hypothetical protein
MEYPVNQGSEERNPVPFEGLNPSGAEVNDVSEGGAVDAWNKRLSIEKPMAGCGGGEIHQRSHA